MHDFSWDVTFLFHTTLQEPRAVVENALAEVAEEITAAQDPWQTAGNGLTNVSKESSPIENVTVVSFFVPKLLGTWTTNFSIFALCLSKRLGVKTAFLTSHNERNHFPWITLVPHLSILE